MSDKVMWLEGMVLSPHHFQQAESFLNQDRTSRLKLLTPFYYGLVSIDIDREALEGGFFSLKECSGILPDGTWFSFPAQDGQLDQRPFEANFTAAKERLAVYLALPAMQPGNPNYSAATEDGGKPPRFIGQTREVPDLNSGGNPRILQFGRQNLRVLFEGESTSGLLTIKLGELRRNAQGRIQSDEEYLPTCLRLSASAGLTTLVKKLADNAQQKSNYLMSQRAQKATGIAQFSADSLTGYLLLSALNNSLPEILHFLKQPSVHPETLYRRLIGFAGSLLSFGADAKVSDIPPYLHGDMGSTFVPLFQLLEALLNASVPTGYKSLSLVKTSPVQYLANMKDLDMGQVREYYLGISAQVSEVEILTSMQRKAKIGPSAKIETLVSHALPGLPLIPETLPPQGIPAKAGYKYFRIHQTGELWEGVQQSKSLALHLPMDLPSPKLELFALLV